MISLLLKQTVTFSHLKYIKRKIVILNNSISSAGHSVNLDWPATKIRQSFINYFQDRHEHLFVPSSSVVPQKGDGVYFTNAGMNQFKSLFLGTTAPNSAMARYRRVVNSQKCIRVGGKHNDLQDVGRDLYHHTFFEMLGNWSFSDYFKRETCEMALDLLTNTYHVPMERLYVTYFSGDEQLGLEPDKESHDIWLSLGFAEERILAFGVVDNFWEMGATGPCGPCTEIHYDHVGTQYASSLVNTGSHDVTELWNLVFIQFDRQMDGSLTPLKRHHVDTGLGLERLAAVLQKTQSNYDTDLFTPLFEHIHQNSESPKYSGRIGSDDIGGIDTAYRIVADHARMFTVSIADGVMPARHNMGHRLRDIVHRCIKNCNSVLHTSPRLVSSLVDIVVESLGDAYPELKARQSQIKAVVSETEERYMKGLMRQKKDLDYMLHGLADIHDLTDKQLEWLEERCADIVADHPRLCAVIGQRGTSPAPFVEEHVSNNTLNTAPLLSQDCVDWLVHRGLHSTGSSLKYSYHKDNNHNYVMDDLTSEVCTVVADGLLIDRVTYDDPACGSYAIVTRESNFYGESGGQCGDTGVILGNNGEFEVTDVQNYRGYVVHKGHCKEGHIAFHEYVTLRPNMEARMGSTYNHSATHLLSHALSAVLEAEVSQHGSAITPHKLTFDFTCSECDINSTLESVENHVLAMIEGARDVCVQELSHDEAFSVPQLRHLPSHIYPDVVRVVSMGTSIADLHINNHNKDDASVELCGGTHVTNTRDVRSFCITKCTYIAHGTVRITAVTHHLAQTAWNNHKQAKIRLEDIKDKIKAEINCQKCRMLVKEVDKLLSQSVFPRSRYICMKAELATLKNKIQRRENSTKVKDLVQGLIDNMACESVHPYNCWQLQFSNISQAVKAMHQVKLEKPLCLVSSSSNTTTAVLYLANEQTEDPLATVSSIAQSLPKARHGQISYELPFYVITLRGSNRETELMRSVSSALSLCVQPL